MPGLIYEASSALCPMKILAQLLEKTFLDHFASIEFQPRRFHAKENAATENGAALSRNQSGKCLPSFGLWPDRQFKEKDIVEIG